MRYPWCDVYWGSHGCRLMPGHNGHHVCSCCPDPEAHWADPDHDTESGAYCVGTWPYYGPGTRFYGEDVPAGWLRVRD